jgi:type II secretory pathway pseudopilin PulG
MNCRSTSRRRSALRQRSAFTFLEVLFSVMILGIGMIMVAAMFPAALKQTQANVEDGSSASIAQLAYNTMQLYVDTRDVNSANTPPTLQAWSSLDRLLNPYNDGSAVGTPLVYSFHDPRLPPSSPVAPPPGTFLPATAWQMVASNLVLPNDPQYAWLPLFARSTINTVSGAPTPPYSPTAKLERSFRLFVIPVRCRNRSSGYIGTPSAAGSDVATDANNDPTNLDPALINVNLIIPPSSTGNPPYLQVAGVYYGNWSGSTPPADWFADTGQSGSVPLDSNPQFNPVATGCYIVISDAGPGTGANASYNGAIFKVGAQVQGGSATPQNNGVGTGTTGEYWSIAPDPNGYSTAALVAANPAGTTIALNKALVVGCGPDTSSAAYQAWATSSSTMQASPMPRAGVAQDMGILLTVVPLP